MNKSILFCILSSILMTGCSSFSSEEEIEKAPVPQYQPSIVSEKEVHDAFIQAAQNVDKALLVYTEVNNAAKQEELTYEKIRQANWEAQYIPSGMERRRTFTWDGPLRPLISQLAKDTDYQIRFIGELPPEPHTISVVANETMVIDVIRDINAKVDGLVDISIHDKNEIKLIEVIYVDRFK